MIVIIIIIKLNYKRLCYHIKLVCDRVYNCRTLEGIKDLVY